MNTEIKTIEDINGKLKHYIIIEKKNKKISVNIREATYNKIAKFRDEEEDKKQMKLELNENN